MDSTTSTYLPNQQAYNTQQSALDAAWAQFGGLTPSNDCHATHASLPFFQYAQGPFPGKGSMSQVFSENSASAPQRNMLKMASRPRSLTTSQSRKQRSKPAQTSREQPFSKRPRISQNESNGQTQVVRNGVHEVCNSKTGSQSECCSSCPDDEPCAEPGCEMQCVAVPCFQPSCEQTVCTNPCLAAGMKNTKISSENSGSDRTTNWLESTWTPQVPRGVNQTNNLIDPALMMFETPDASGSPAPTTPSMGNNIETPYSPNTALPTPQLTSFPGQSTYPTQSGEILSGTGAIFNPSTEQWLNSSFENSNYNNGSMYYCPWTGCEQPFPSLQEWLPHLHRDHVDPQMRFGCPIPAKTCPPTIDANPLEHLQTYHGYNFDMNGNGFSCPAPDCAPGDVFCNPAMLHNHFDHVHATPAQGPLQCRLNECEASFEDPHQLISHINEHHHLPIPKDDDIELSMSSQTANILASLPKAIAIENNTEFACQGVSHCCKWKSADEVCGKVCTSEEDLQKHIKYGHLEVLDKNSGYKCQWDGCSRESRRGEEAGFSQRGKLERHMATHTGYKCCACEECGKTFSAEQSLRQHQLLHKGEKPWICKHCGKGFPQQSACTIHERTHTKEKPLECNICGKRFSESSNLSKHRKIHGEKGLNSCDFPGCGKSFHRFDQLKRHRMTHERRAAKARGSVAASETESVVTRTNTETGTEDGSE